MERKAKLWCNNSSLVCLIQGGRKDIKDVKIRFPFFSRALVVSKKSLVLLLLVLHLQVFLDVGRGVGGGVGAGAAVAAASAEGQEDDLPSLPQLECASGCKRIFIGDNHCDKECFNAECEWDGGDCEKSCELRRLVVMGPYYKEVDHVEFQCVGPAGQMQAVPFEEGLKWEGITPPGASDEDEEEDWRKALSDL